MTVGVVILCGLRIMTVVSAAHYGEFKLELQFNTAFRNKAFLHLYNPSASKTTCSWVKHTETLGFRVLNGH